MEECEEVRIECLDHCGRFYKRRTAKDKIMKCIKANGNKEVVLTQDVGALFAD